MLYRPHTPYRARASLLALMGAHVISSAGLTMTFVAIPWFVLEVTDSITRTGLLITAYTVTAAAAGLLAGPLVDRLGFRRISVLAYLVGGAAMATVVLLFQLDALTFPLLLGLVILATVFDAPGGVALSGLVPGLARASGVPLLRVNAGFRAISGISQLIGPALGGLAAAMFGSHRVLLLDALASLIAGMVVLTLVRPATARTAPADAASFLGYLRELRQGVEIIVRDRLLRTLTATSAGHAFLDGALSGVVLLAAGFYWYSGSSSFGSMVTAVAAGALVGTILYGILGPRLPRRAVYVTSTIGIGIPMLLLGTVPPLGVALVALALSALIGSPMGPLSTSVIQETAPPGMYARVASTSRVAGAAAYPLGVSSAAATVTVYGLQPTLIGLALGYLVIGIGCAWSWSLRDLDRPQTESESTTLQEELTTAGQSVN